jgi:hypothetical protein
MNHSESVAKIAAALAAFQAEVKDPRRDGSNPHFRSKYVQIDGLLDAVRPVLSKNGLSVVQSTGGNGQDISVTTMILHNSGEWIETDALVLRAQKVDPQGAGSAVTYGRRYGLSAALGVAWDDDDDGNAASAPRQEVAPKDDAKTAALRYIFEEGTAKGVKAQDFADIIKLKYKKVSSKALTEAEIEDLGKNYMKYMEEIL